MQKKYIMISLSVILAIMIFIPNKVSALSELKFKKYTGSIEDLNNGTLNGKKIMICNDNSYLTGSSPDYVCVNSDYLVTNEGNKNGYILTNSFDLVDNYLTVSSDNTSILQLEYNSDNTFYIKNVSNNSYLYDGVRLSYSSSAITKFEITNKNDNYNSYAIHFTNLDNKYLKFRYYTPYLEKGSDDYTSHPQTLFHTYIFIEEIPKTIKFTDNTLSFDKNGVQYTSFSIDFSDYENSDVNYVYYKFEYSFDNINFYDISSDVRNNYYYFPLDLWGNTIIYARVLDSNGNIITTNSIDVNYLLNLENYKLVKIPKDKKYAIVSGLASGSILFDNNTYNLRSPELYYLNGNDISTAASNQLVDYIDVLNKSFKKFNYTLESNQFVLVSKGSPLSSYDYDFNFYVPEDAIVTFTTPVAPEEGCEYNKSCNVTFDGGFTDLDGTYKEFHIVNTYTDTITFFDLFKNSFSSFIKTFNYISSLFTTFLESCPPLLTTFFYFIFGLFVILFIIKIIL